MLSFYHSLAQKAILVLLLGAVLYTSDAAWARVPTDPEYAAQQMIWEQIGAPTAWDITTGSSDVVVAVIDTGVDTWHDDLKGNIWTNPYEIPDNGRDDDHNGYIDDLHGWNFVENNNDVRTSVFEHADDPEAVRHGTLIAGLIGAEGNNNESGVGLNWRIKLMPIRAIQSSGAGDYATVSRAIDYAVANGAHIITMSFVGDINDTVLKDHLKAAYDHGVLIVAAAGNHSRNSSGNLNDHPLYPACYDQGDTVNWFLTVGSVNTLDQLSRFSNYGTCLDLVAPGENIFSTERYAPQFGYQKKFNGPWKGTSFSAPLVAGAAALLKSIHPEWGPVELIQTLRNTADPIEAQNLSLASSSLGRGRLNIGKAVAVAMQLKRGGPAGGYYYFFNGPVINRLNFTSSSVETVAHVGDNIIKSVAIYNPNISTKTQVAALLEGKPFYHVRLVRDTGELIQDFSLELSIRKDAVVKRLAVTTAPGAPSPFIVEVYYPQKKQTVFKAFDVRGELAQEAAVPGEVSGWAIGRNNPEILLAQRVGKKTEVRRISWNGGAVQSWKISEDSAARIEAVRVGQVLPGKNEQGIILLRRGRRVEQLILETNIGTITTRLIDVTADPAPWRLLLAQSTATDSMLIFPFTTGGGIFRLATGAGEPVAEIKLPRLNGLTN